MLVWGNPVNIYMSKPISISIRIYIYLYIYIYRGVRPAYAEHIHTDVEEGSPLYTYISKIRISHRRSRARCASRLWKKDQQVTHTDREQHFRHTHTRQDEHITTDVGVKQNRVCTYRFIYIYIYIYIYIKISICICPSI